MKARREPLLLSEEENERNRHGRGRPNANAALAGKRSTAHRRGSPKAIGMPAAIATRDSAPRFSHIFTGDGHSAGDTRDPAASYRAFRGRDPGARCAAAQAGARIEDGGERRRGMRRDDARRGRRRPIHRGRDSKSEYT
jgi:hypothetical protein